MDVGSNVLLPHERFRIDALNLRWLQKSINESAVSSSYRFEMTFSMKKNLLASVVFVIVNSLDMLARSQAAVELLPDRASWHLISFPRWNNDLSRIEMSYP